MAATILGDATLTFGGTAETVAVFTSFSQSTDSDEAIVLDQQGDRIAVAKFGLRSTVNLSGYTNAAAVPDVAASIVLANDDDTLGGLTAGGTFYVDNVSIAIAPNDFKQVTISATNHNFA